MGRLAQTDGLTDIQTEILDTVRRFVDKEILPHVAQLERDDEYPADIVEGMKEMGLFGLMIPEEYGGLGESLLTYALVVEEIARGWMSVSGIINTHFIVAYLLKQHGTDEQRAVPAAADGHRRGARLVLDVRARPRLGRQRDLDARGEGRRRLRHHRPEDVDHQRRHVEPAGRPRQDRRGRRHAVPQHDDVPRGEASPASARRMPGLTIPGKIEKMGYKGVDSTEAVFDGHRVPATRVLGGETGKGFYQMMDGVEVGRVNVAARGCGVALRAFELGIEYAQQRSTFGKPIAQHQAVLFRLAEMATKVEAAHSMMVMAARKKDAGERNDVEAGMAKYLASEYCKEVVEDSFRIHGGYGYSKEYEIERLYREAPMLLIGEGTSDIQKMIIGRRLLEEYKLRG